MPTDEEAAAQQRFLVGCLVVAALLISAFVLFATPLPGLLVMFTS